MDNNAPDPEILDRLDGQEPQDAPDEPEQEQEEAVEEEAPVEEQEQEEEVTDEEALANSKNPERTAKRMEELREQAKRNDVMTESTPQAAPQIDFDPNQYFQGLTQQQQQQVANVPQDQAQDIYSEMVGKDGYLDQNKFFEALKQSDLRVQQAQQEAKRANENAQRTSQQFQNFYKQSTMRDVHNQYPSLDPQNDDFDEKFFEQVRNELIFQQTQGQMPDPMSAASKWYTEPVNKKEKEQKKEAVNTRANINATRGTSPQRQSTAEREQLIDQTRQGGKRGTEALAQRLKNIEQ